MWVFWFYFFMVIVMIKENLIFLCSFGIFKYSQQNVNVPVANDYDFCLLSVLLNILDYFLILECTLSTSRYRKYELRFTNIDISGSHRREKHVGVIETFSLSRKHNCTLSTLIPHKRLAPSSLLPSIRVLFNWCFRKIITFLSSTKGRWLDDSCHRIQIANNTPTPSIYHRHNASSSTAATSRLWSHYNAVA